MEDTLNKVDILDHGYVRLVDVMGSDLTVVNAARVSYAKESGELSGRDVRLIKFLASAGHTSPFRHAIAQFEIYAPLMVARQHWKYVIGSAHAEGSGDSLDAWNESSRRYITEEPTFYIPQRDEWRTAPENSKQGSGKKVDDHIIADAATFQLERYVAQGIKLYENAMKAGIAPEQARLFLPAYGMYVRWYWTASLQSVCHFLAQRLEHDAQKEIQEYAKAILTLIEPHFPVAVGELLSD